MKLNRTTQRTIEILKLISRNIEGTTLDEICDTLSLPKTSAYDIVTTLAEMGMINIDRGQRQRYTIGLMAYRIGINYTNNMDFISIIEPELKVLAKDVGKTVFFGVRSIERVLKDLRLPSFAMHLLRRTIRAERRVYNRTIVDISKQCIRARYQSGYLFERITSYFDVLSVLLLN